MEGGIDPYKKLPFKELSARRVEFWVIEEFPKEFSSYAHRYKTSKFKKSTWNRSNESNVRNTEDPKLGQLANGCWDGCICDIFSVNSTSV